MARCASGCSRRVAGFRPDPEAPGFQHIIFEPTIIPALSPVAAHHDSAAGRIEAGWTVDGDRVTYDIVVPDGASGTLVLVAAYKDIAVDGAPLRLGRRRAEARSLLAPGRHKVTFRIEQAVDRAATERSRANDRPAHTGRNDNDNRSSSRRWPLVLHRAARPLAGLAARRR